MPRAAYEDANTYQNVELWERELRAAGWLEVPGGRGWRSPSGLLYRGPYRAWRVMRDADFGRSND